MLICCVYIRLDEHEESLHNCQHKCDVNSFSW